MRKVFVSACITGIHCRYDGSAVWAEVLDTIEDEVCLIPVCPEVYGGMPTPRNSGERLGEKVIDSHGADVTDYYTRGAEDLIRLAKRLGVTAAILKERSPSCGCGVIYDGTFTSKKIKGNGVFAQLLKDAGIHIFSETDLDGIMGFVRENDEETNG